MLRFFTTGTQIICINIVGMERMVSYFIFYTQCVIILFSFICSIALSINKKRLVDKILCSYVFIGFVEMCLLILDLNQIIHIKSANLINNISTIIGFNLLSIYLIKSEVLLRSKSFFFGFNIVVTLLIIYFLIAYPKESTEMNLKVFSIYHFALLFYSIYFLISVVTNDQVDNKSNESNESKFWLSIGIFICSVLSIPVSIYHGFYSELTSEEFNNFYLSALTPLGFIFLYLGVLRAIFSSYKN